MKNLIEMSMEIIFFTGAASGSGRSTHNVKRSRGSGRHDGRPNAARWQRPGAQWEETHRGRLPPGAHVQPQTKGKFAADHKRADTSVSTSARPVWAARCAGRRVTLSRGGASSRPSFCNQNQVRRGPGAHGARCCGGKSGVSACTTLTLPIPSKTDLRS